MSTYPAPIRSNYGEFIEMSFPFKFKPSVFFMDTIFGYINYMATFMNNWISKLKKTYL